MKNAGLASETRWWCGSSRYSYSLVLLNVATYSVTIAK